MRKFFLSKVSFPLLPKFSLRSPILPEESRQTFSLLTPFLNISSTEVLLKLNTTLKGLRTNEAKARLEKYGLNDIKGDKPANKYTLLLKYFINPFIVLLVMLAGISLFLSNIDAAIIISVMVAISVIIRFFQEWQSKKTAAKLKAMVSTQATVLRREDSNSEPQKQEIDIKLLVPGDIIHLSAGDMVPADVRLLSAKELYVSQSSLSGESLPVEKEAISHPARSTENLWEMPHLCFMGTHVFNGTALAVVLTTGEHTYLGGMAKSITHPRPLTAFDIGISKVSWLLIRLMCITVPIVFLLNGFIKGDWLESLLFALSVAVGLTPEMLPMIITVNLAKGAVSMSHHRVIVKHLNAIQNFGAMNILCTDKTGTLTQDKVILERHLDIEGNDNQEVLLFGYLNSFYQTGLKNLLDKAILEHSEIEKTLDLRTNYKKIDEIPFDFVRKRMSVIVEKNAHEHLLICKGAFEEVLSLCSGVKIKGSTLSLSLSLKDKINNLAKELYQEGMRILAVAYKCVEPTESKEYTEKDEKEMVLLGLLTFLDPPKSTAAEAIAQLRCQNVQVKILTGDNEWVTHRICQWVNLKVENSLTGHELEKMNDKELSNVVDHTTLFTKLTPLQKSRVIASLKSNGHIVGYLGDGINDAPALCEADVGISVDTAVDIAKESADIIMLEKSLLFLNAGVVEGRKTFGNILKYLKMALSANFGNVFSILGASALFPFLPMLPIQLLIQNLLYEISQATIPWDHVDPEFLAYPQRWERGDIAKFMLVVGPISSIFDYITFAVMWFIFAANTPEKQSIFQTGWFIEGLLSQTLIVHMIRTPKIPFIQSMTAWPLTLTTWVIIAIGIYLPYACIGASIGLVPLPWSYFPWLLIILLGYCLLTQLVKMWFIKKFGRWL
ncbi:magnesium-translocating P-type ATPase [Neochlamydia sp. S13]|uniref:magnesium-translocating P-type ATPase n=1 Tax=Neochlamydia sp. S13 TaxID=1353976 RepID=UPI0009AD45C1|nr:magnesium-translocating P-type ATPase [Neochlamydia sp. S13]